MVTCNDLAQNYLNFLADGFSCEADGPFTVLTTPYMYADGDNIDLYIEQYGDYIVVSDMGETARRLALLQYNWKSKIARSLFAHILSSTGTSSVEGKIYTKLMQIEDVGDKVNDLIHAIQQTDNLAFTIQDYSPRDFRDDVEIFLRKSGFEPELNYQIDGISGNLWRIHFYFNHNSNILTKALSSNSRGGAKNLIQATYTAYDDIKKLHPNVVRTVILDDTKEIWEPEFINLANQVIDKEVGFWSKRNEFSDMLHSVTGKNLHT
jgi:hypothetical protein